MASLETLVAFFRNGLCVCVDTLPGTHYLKLPLKAVIFEVSSSSKWQVPSFVVRLLRVGTVEEMSVLNVCIACLQTAAVCFNVVGASSLPRAVREYGRLRVIETRVATKSRSHVAQIGASLAVRRATSTAAFALVRLMLGPSFTVLALYTTRLASQRLLEWALLLMQVALGIALAAMWRELTYRRRKVANTTALAAAPDTEDPELLEAVDDIPSESEGLIALVSKADDPEKVSERCEVWIKAARKFAAENQLELRNLAHRERQAVVVDSCVFVLNFVAFFGYLVFPVTYFLPFPRDPRVEWLGNFAGDLAWTLEPAIVIATSLRRAPSPPKAKSD
mmetsp:Transcript_23806/g.74488  ORF Transcript_23806/g.74488 Transcript_23806/m.74488 type:complete len:335 (-) Transcript_23806:595-1599(-)